MKNVPAVSSLACSGYQKGKQYDTKLNDHSFRVNVRAGDETVITTLVKKFLVFVSKAIAMSLPKYCAS